VSATTGVTLGGRSFGTQTKTGRLAPARQGSVELRGGQYVVRLPAASAILLVGNQALVSTNG